jgi:hypothetical protein
MSENANNLPGTNMPDGDELSLGNIASVGFSNPGSPGDEMGSAPAPELGGVGAMDPGSGVDVEGADQRGAPTDARLGPDMAGSDEGRDAGMTR